MNEHEKALPAGGPAKPTQNAVKIYVISSRERLLLPLAFCFCLLLVNTLLWSGPTAGLTAAVCVWYGLLGLYLGRTLLNTWESRVLLAVNLALAATLALGSNWYFRAWNLLALLALLWGIPLDQCAAVGDSENDLAMLQAVGTSIAMGNGCEAVKAAARHIAPDNAHEGVAHAIRWAMEQP